MKTITMTVKAKTNKNSKEKFENKILSVCTWIGKTLRRIRKFKRKHPLLYLYILCALVLLIGLPIGSKLAEVGIIVFY